MRKLDIEDLYMVAETLSGAFARLSSKYPGEDIRSSFRVSITLPEESVLTLDRSIYKGINRTDEGYEPSDTIEANVLGVHFTVSGTGDLTTQ